MKTHIKIVLTLFSLAMWMGCTHPGHALKPGTYPIMLRTQNTEPMDESDTIEIPGSIDTVTIKSLPDPLRGLAALYAAKTGSWCDGEYCDLTTALSLGKQGSEQHQQIIRKYFPDDSLAGFLLKQNCVLGKDGSSCFNNYEYLAFIVRSDTVTVNYRWWYSCGESEGSKEESDMYIFTGGHFKKILRDDRWIF